MANRKTIGYIASAVFGAIFIGSIVIIGVIFSEQDNSENEVPAWWQKTVIYHVYIPSFKDSNGDGFGDLKGKIGNWFLTLIVAVRNLYNR